MKAKNKDCSDALGAGFSNCRSQPILCSPEGFRGSQNLWKVGGGVGQSSSDFVDKSGKILNIIYF